MKLPNWFKIAWWGVLLVFLSYAVFVRFDAYEAGNVTGMDALVLLVWLALAMVPVFNEMELLGFKFKQEREDLPQQSPVNTERSNAENLSNVKVKELLDGLNDQLTNEHVNVLKKSIDDMKPTPEERDEILFRLLAENQIAVRFEQTYSHIFGSQLRALQYLNGAAGSNKEMDSLKSFYNDAKDKNPEVYKNYSYEKWFAFLQSASLIGVYPSGIDISVRGQSFINYLNKYRYSLEKHG